MLQIYHYLRSFSDRLLLEGRKAAQFQVVSLASSSAIELTQPAKSTRAIQTYHFIAVPFHWQTEVYRLYWHYCDDACENAPNNDPSGK